MQLHVTLLAIIYVIALTKVTKFQPQNVLLLEIFAHNPKRQKCLSTIEQYVL